MDVSKETPAKEVFEYWIIEREKIFQRKELWKQPKPWSDDAIFQNTYFCNVRREDDRVTRWIRDHSELGADLAPLNMIVARLVNKTDSLYQIGWPWTDLDKDGWFYQMSKKGAWGSAYIVSTNGRPMAKHEYIWGLLEQARAHLTLLPPATLAGTLAGAHSALQGVPGLASFMAAQVVADLKNTTGHPLQDAVDWWSFAAPGPGSLRGLSWFHERKVTAKDFTEALASARSWALTSGVAGIVANICNQDLQNCFCEYDKYMRILHGTGRSKRKYPGT